MVKKKNYSYDIIFIDPPFFQKKINKTLYLLEKYSWLKNSSFIYIEQENSKSEIYVPQQWKIYREKISKKVIYRLYFKSYI